MTYPISGVPGRIGDFVMRWIQSRIQECRHCSECGDEVTPFTTFCPRCGQENPAKVSRSAVLCLVLGFVSLTLLLSFVMTVL
jgi:predicted amidophosphoribosyltransferase